MNGAAGDANSGLTQPEEFDAATANARPQEIRKRVFVSSRPADHVDHLRAVLAIGVESVNIHNVGLNQLDFLKTFGREVLPMLRMTD